MLSLLLTFRDAILSTMINVVCQEFIVHNRINEISILPDKIEHQFVTPT